MTELVIWHTKGAPDDDVIVLVQVPGASESVWVGYALRDDEGGVEWFYADSSRIELPVTAWADIPNGPPVKLKPTRKKKKAS